MKNRSVKIIIVTLLGLFLFLQPALAVSVLDASNEFMKPCLETGNCNLCHFVAMFIQASDVLIYISGVMAVAMFIYGGVVLITSYGNESRVKWGKDVISSTIVGIFIVMTAWTLINTLLFSLYGSDTGNFGLVTEAAFEGPKLENWGGLCSNIKSK